jgi:hypothetical protein
LCVVRGFGGFFLSCKANGLEWLGHIERMQETRIVKEVHSWKPISKRPVGRPKTRWEDDVRKDVQKLKVKNWKTIVQDRRIGSEGQNSA